MRQGGCFAACLRFVLAVRRLISAVDDERKDELFGFAGPNDELPAGEALFGQFVLFFFVHAAAEHAPAIELLSRSSTRALFGAAGANFCEQRCALRSRFWHSVLRATKNTIFGQIKVWSTLAQQLWSAGA